MGIFFSQKKIGEKKVTGVHFVRLLLPQELYSTICICRLYSS